MTIKSFRVVFDFISSTNQKTVSFCKQHFVALTLLLTTFILLSRFPVIIVHPRMWAEEGAFYFADAYRQCIEHKISFSSFFNSYYFGYFNFIAGFSAVLSAVLVPLEYAPYISLMISFGIQLVPTMIIAKSRSEFWNSYWRKLLAILAILYIPLAGEAWLNTITSQFHFGVIAFLILLEAPESIQGFRKYFFNGLLLVGGLSGVQAIFLTPLFFLKWIQTKHWNSFLNCFFLGSAACIQTLEFFLDRSRITGRFLGVDFKNYFIVTAYRNWILPFWGFINDPVISRVMLLHMFNQALWTQIVGYILFTIMIGYWFWIIKRIKGHSGLWIVASFFLATFLTWLGMLAPRVSCLDTGGGGRYIILTNSILMIGFLGAIDFTQVFGKQTKHTSQILFIIACFAIFQGSRSYGPITPAQTDWPIWREEVEAWRADPTKTTIQIWPPGWSISLDHQISKDS